MYGFCGRFWGRYEGLGYGFGCYYLENAIRVKFLF